MNFDCLRHGGSATVVFDTDMCGDVDDVGALFLLLSASKKYGFRIGGITVNVNSPNEYPAIMAMLEELKMTEIPVGVYDGENPESGNYAPYVEFLAKHYNGEHKSITAMEIYQKVLSESCDNSVVIVSVGFFNNINRARNKNTELFDKKVRAVVAMAGRFDEEGFPEFNIREFVRDSKEFIESFDGEIIFGGFEIGYQVMTDLRDIADRDSLLTKAYEIYTEGRMLRESWDPLTVDFAVNGENEYYGLSARGKVTVLNDRSTKFEQSEKGNCRYIFLKRSFEQTGAHISNAIKQTLRL
ncbi:MAG: nucleoside hydrolase [Clostridia bacterium]|nr:nucleoside hydrolase [Clostridia bacterium]